MRKLLIVVTSLFTLASNGQISDETVIEEQLDLANELSFNYPDSGLAIAMSAYSEAHQTKHIDQQLRANYLIARIYYIKGEYDNSLDQFLKLRELAEEYEQPHWIAESINGQGLIHLGQDQFEEAKQLFQIGLEIGLEQKDSARLAKSHLNLSICYDGLAKYPLALEHAAECISISRKITNKLYLPMALNREGAIYSDLSRFEKSVQKHLNALELVDPNNEWEKCFSYAGLCVAFNGLTLYEQSISYGKRALELALKLDSKWESQRVAKFISSAYAKMGHYEEAYEYHVIHKTLSDSLFNQEKQADINALHLRQSMLENQHLLAENELKEERLKSRSLAVFAFSGLSVVLVVFVLVLYRNNIQRKMYSASLIEKNTQIAHQRDELQQLSKTKDRILSVIAHDMRSPLNSLLAMLHLQKTGALVKEETDMLEADIHKRITSVTAILNNLLGWAQNQFRGANTSPETFNPIGIVDEQIALLALSSHEKGILIQHSQDDASKIYWDIEHFRIIVRNLIDNAIKFTRENGSIRLWYEQKDKTLLLHIQDNGVGLEETELDKLFSVGSSTKGTHDEIGTGLGLSLCKEYAESNGGSITVSSKIGDGSTFTVHLPMAQ
jgi:signal transduction histidine kinase